VWTNECDYATMIAKSMLIAVVVHEKDGYLVISLRLKCLTMLITMLSDCWCQNESTAFDREASLRPRDT
jgi:hypothetical protein